jgi:hypothetical protein
METKVVTILGASYFCWHTRGTIWWKAAHTEEPWVYRFIAKCDMVILLFDPHKLVISDEFKKIIMFN